MSRSSRRLAGTLFRPDPWLRPAASPDPSVPLPRHTSHSLDPWPWPTPPPQADLFGRTKKPVPWQSRDVKVAALRLAGVALILLGLGTVGYLTVTTWLANKAAEQAQDRLSAEFEDSVGASAVADPAYVEDPTVGSTSLPPPTTAGTTLAHDATTTSPPSAPTVIGEVPPEAGRALGRIVIPAAGVDWVIVEGVTPADLSQGPGHMPGTALPGQPGNAVISGHRTTHGAPFGDLELLAPGDQISVATLIGTHTYQVVEVVVVAPDDTWVTNQVVGAWLTLTTCHPEGSSQQRLVVFARLVSGPNAEAIPDAGTPPQPA